VSLEREADVARAAALAGGEVIARHASAERRASFEKSDDNPVTAADLEANAAILAVIRAAFPDDTVLSEETADSRARLGAERVWIVDPLDGTKEFVEGVPEFAVSSLVVRRRPVAGASTADDAQCWAHTRRREADGAAFR
jgi:3'-phosphoadenosine 5'-phosphosulfate (PAPS) 3'-phosphatase